MGAQDEYDEHIRKGERDRIARHMKTVANGLLHDNGSDAIDGFVAAAIIELAETIESNGQR